MLGRLAISPLLTGTLARLLVHSLHGHHPSLYQATGPGPGRLCNGQTTLLARLRPPPLPQPPPYHGPPSTYPHVWLRPLLTQYHHAGQDDRFLERSYEVDHQLLLLNPSPYPGLRSVPLSPILAPPS